MVKGELLFKITNIKLTNRRSVFVIPCDIYIVRVREKNCVPKLSSVILFATGIMYYFSHRHFLCHRDHRSQKKLRFLSQTQQKLLNAFFTFLITSALCQKMPETPKTVTGNKKNTDIKYKPIE